SPLDARARGGNGLIREGAHLVETAADILDNLPDHPLREGVARLPLFAHGAAPGMAEPEMEPPAAPDLPDAERTKLRDAVLRLLSPAPTAVDDLIRHGQFSAPAVLSVLLDLDIAGRVEMLVGNRVVLTGY
ncbi:MAG TPA: DNA-protecting protein DprA, partial [Acetobacteraceae bacterium]